ncbi:hypothetical protein WSM22_37140 [Cytophagales bacterium WSM2-2]|nr:hypothetical protein WSM22_37140 [Cytophagales bacterium WSM2-2]
MAIIDQIRSKINEVFKSSTQTFIMEFPGRVLNKNLYAYDTSSNYADETKPQPVLENEFRLTNDLFDVGQIAGGPNGRKLSSVYEEALNMLVPKFDTNGDFYKDKQKIRNWLLEEVEHPDDKKPEVKVKISRIDLYKKLNREYEEAKRKWKEDKVKQLLAAEGNTKSLDELTRKVAVDAESVDAELDGVFFNLVVKGYYHEVKNCLAYLNIKTIAEQLEDAKSKLRMSSMSSFDESETVLPVQLQPNDWFAGLATDFTPQDLLMDAVFLTDKLLTKQNSLEALDAQIASLKSVRQGDEASLQKEINDAQLALDNAQSQMIKSFSSAAITLIQMYLNKPKDANKPKSKDDFNNDARVKKSGVQLEDKDWDMINDLQKKSIDNQQKLTTSSRALAALQAAKATAKSTDTQISIQALELQASQLRNEIKGLQRIVMAQPGAVGKDETKVVLTTKAFDDTLKNKLTEDLKGEVKTVVDNLLDALKTILDQEFTSFGEMQEVSAIKTALTAITDANKKTNALESWKTLLTNRFSPAAILPSMPPASRWMDVIISCNASELKTNSSLVTGSSETNWSVDLLFASAGGSTSNSWSNFNTSRVEESQEIQIGMRATKVTIDRGWFRPEFFSITQSMYRYGADTKPLANGILLNDSGSNLSQINDTFFPAFPVAFVIVKDVTLKFKATNDGASTIKNVLDSNSSAGGGFLCFSASNSSTLSESGEAFHHKVDGQMVTIKIPGPQIIGWYLEYLPKDLSEAKYVKLPDGALPELEKVSLPKPPPTPPA